MTLYALSFLLVDCGRIDLSFMVHLKRLLHMTWHFRYFDEHFKKKICYQHVRKAVLDVCAKSVPVWGKSAEMRGLLREKNYLDMSFDFLFFHSNLIELCNF